MSELSRNRGSSEELGPHSPDHKHYRSMAREESLDETDAAPSRRRQVTTMNETSTSASMPTADNSSLESGDSLDMDPDVLLLYGSKQVIRLFVPVTLCMLLVVIIMSSMDFYKPGQGTYLVYTPFHDDDADTGTKVWQSVANSLIMLCIIVVMTVVLIVLFKKRCYKIIHGWLIFTTVMLLFVFSFMFLQVLIVRLNIPSDYFTVAFVMWNFGVVGLFVIHWKGPLLLQQAYLISVSVQISLIFIKFLPDWTGWVLLGVISLWDLFAVLCPQGPLRILVQTAQERNEPLMPGLIYSTTTNMVTMTTRDRGGQVEEDRGSIASSMEPLHDDSESHREAVVALNGASDSHRKSASRAVPNTAEGGSSTRSAATDGGNERPAALRIRHEAMRNEDHGVKLGLGDFIFYSVLVGKASTLGDWNTTLACYVAILVGLVFTLLLLAIAGKALPALPISIAFGLIFYFTTSLIVTPFSDALSAKQYYV